MSTIIQNFISYIILNICSQSTVLAVFFIETLLFLQLANLQRSSLPPSQNYLPVSKYGKWSYLVFDLTSLSSPAQSQFSQSVIKSWFLWSLYGKKSIVRSVLARIFWPDIKYLSRFLVFQCVHYFCITNFKVLPWISKLK